MRTEVKNINIRVGNIELRTYKGWNNPEIDGDISDKYEFVKWNIDSKNKEYCYVLAFAERTSDGYDIRSVGIRPWELDKEDLKDYNDLVKIFFRIEY